MEINEKPTIREALQQSHIKLHDSRLSRCLKMEYQLLMRSGAEQCSVWGRFLGVIGQNPGSSKSNRLHIVVSVFWLLI